MHYVSVSGIDIQVSALCLGVPEIGIRQTEVDAHRLLDFWIQNGGNCIDTARVYSDWIAGEKHRSERILGDWLRVAGGRERIVLATKGGHPFLENSSCSRLSPSELRDDLEGSLETLGTDYIDLWWLHRDDEKIPVEQIIDTCDPFVRDGHVKALGAANWTAKRIRKANEYALRAGKAAFVATQLFWNVGSRHYRGLESTSRSMDDDAEQLHQACNLVAMPYSSQAGGFFGSWLEGDNVARKRAEKSGYATKRNFQIAGLVGEIARRNGVPAGAVVLAFLRSHAFKVIPIVGCGTPSRLAASIQALDFALSDADWKSLRELTSREKRSFGNNLGKGISSTTVNSQTEAFKVKFAAGLLQPFSRLNISVRLGQLSLNVLSRWPIKPLPPKPQSGLRYVTIGGRAHWLMLRESLFSVYRSWKNLPMVTVVSDGSWSANDFHPIFAWWPKKINVLTREQIIAQADAAGECELARYAQASPYGLKLASIVLLARQEPVLFVDADILWFKDPADLLGPVHSWARPRGVRESNCYQHRAMALRYCPKVLEPPFVNGGIVGLQGEFLAPEILRAMVHETLADPTEGTFEQTIIATAVHKGAGLLPNELNLVEFDDVHKFCRRNMKKEGYYSRHYVNWMRHVFYRDALRLRWKALIAGNYSFFSSLVSEFNI